MLQTAGPFMTCAKHCAKLCARVTTGQRPSKGGFCRGSRPSDHRVILPPLLQRLGSSSSEYAALPAGLCAYCCLCGSCLCPRLCCTLHPHTFLTGRAGGQYCRALGLLARLRHSVHGPQHSFLRIVWTCDLYNMSHKAGSWGSRGPIWSLGL